MTQLKSLSHATVQAFLNLASSEQREDMAVAGLLQISGDGGSELARIMQAKMERQKTEQLEELADTILVLLGEAKDVHYARLQSIRNLRRQIEAEKAQATNVAMARDYGLETQNFLPLLVALGKTCFHHTYTPQSRIPEEWAQAWVKKQAEANQVKAAAPKSKAAPRKPAAAKK